MRRRALVSALLAGGLAAAGAIALGVVAAPRDTPTTATSLARAELADVTAPAALATTRDSSGRAPDGTRGVTAALALALALTLAGGWWLTREHAARVHVPQLLTIRRMRAPPGMPLTVHC